MKNNTKSIINQFKSLKDPRKGKNKSYFLTEIIILTICAVVSGADNWNAIEQYGKDKINWLKTFLKLENGIPSHDTLRRFYSLLNPISFEKCFLNWINSIKKVTKGEIIPIDGKSIRRSFDKKTGKSAIHMISAWSSSNNIVLGQVKTSEKSNEITAIPELLKTLYLEGCIVSIDAIGCQKKIAKQICNQDADYVLAVKSNQGNMYNQISSFFQKDYFDHLNGIDYYETEEEKKHGRCDIRKYWIFKYNSNIFGDKLLNDWKNIKSLGMVESHRLLNGELKIEKRFYITSLLCNAKKFAKIVRNHWAIENKLHWSLDISFREDECRKRVGHSAENFAIIRRIALNFLKNEKSLKLGISNKRLKAAWSNEYLSKVLSLRAFLKTLNLHTEFLMIKFTYDKTQRTYIL